MSLTQTLTQSQLQKLSPQQIQGIKLLELPTLQLEQRIAREIEENPILEEAENSQEQEETAEPKVERDTSLEEYIKAEQSTPSYRLRSNNTSADDDTRPRQISGGKSLNDYLLEQLSFHNLTSRELQIANFVVGSIDDDGYLHRSCDAIADDIAFKLALDVTEEEVEKAIEFVQQMEPAGICARSVNESLILQIKAFNELDSDARLALKILRSHFTELTKKHYNTIMTRSGATKDELRRALDVITSLNPRPSNGYNDEGSASTSPTIIADFLLDFNDITGEFEIELAGRKLPELRINRHYLKMAEDALGGNKTSPESRETLEFVRGKMESAKWFISAIKQRQQTLMTTVKAIVDFQREYFIEGDQSLLRPMILKDIALKTGFDISTISRVVNSKYIETHFGTFSLKHFFSEGLLTESGEEVSTLEIKRIIMDSIENESKSDPLTDEALMNLLHSKGFKIARRTVAKYREMLGIAVARLRKEL